MTHMVQSPDGMRIAPVGNPDEYSTFSIHTPLSTHWRKATCKEINCPYYLNGWGLRIEHNDAAVVYAAEHSGRKFTRKEVAPGENYLVFEAGQSCFQEENHRKKLERDEFYILRRGDWRKSEDAHKLSPTSWLDTFGENQEKLRDAVEKG